MESILVLKKLIDIWAPAIKLQCYMDHSKNVFNFTLCQIVNSQSYRYLQNVPQLTVK